MILVMQLRIPRIVIAGATSGVGKTSITCSIIYLQKKGFTKTSLPRPLGFFSESRT